MKTKLPTILIASFLAGPGLTSVALAQPLSATSPTEVSAEPAPTGASVGIDTDPNIDRAFLQPTAMTQPAGTITYNNYELLLHGFTYGVTDNVQATVTVLSPISTDIPFVGFGAVKWRLLATERVHLALQGSLGYGHEFGSGASNVYTMGAGGFASVCLRDDCESLLSASVNYQLATGDAENNRLHLIIYGGSLVQRLGAHVKLLAEVTSAAGAASSSLTDGNSDFENLPGVLVSYGLRFHTGSMAGDVGFIKPFVGDDDDGLLMGFPFVNLSYRWQ